jgi:hypothetical protein
MDVKPAKAGPKKDLPRNKNCNKDAKASASIGGLIGADGVVQKPAL